MKKDRIIVISREYGSAGSRIGQLLAEELGIPYYDRNYVDKVVENSGLSADFMDEEEHKFISSLLFNLATGGYRRASDETVGDQVFISMSNAIKEVAQQGPCVIVGRCADFVLRNDYDLFTVFIHADMSVRCRRGVEEYGIDERRVEQIIKDKDRSRARHYEYYTDRTWGDRNNYHLSVNSGRFGIAKSVEVIRKALETLDEEN